MWKKATKTTNTKLAFRIFLIDSYRLRVENGLCQTHTNYGQYQSNFLYIAN